MSAPPVEVIPAPLSLPKGISWTLFKRALECHTKVEFHRRDMPQRNSVWPTYYADTGSTVQRVFELYFNQGVNLRPGGAHPDKIISVGEQVLAQDPQTLNLLAATTFPSGKNRADLMALIRGDIKNGVHALHAGGLLAKRVKSEVGLGGDLAGYRIFGQHDFIVDNGDGTVDVWDGKSMSQKNADKNQLRFYVKTIDIPVRRAGFLYWRQGEAVEIDISEGAMQATLMKQWAEAVPVWEKLKVGILHLEPTAKDSNTCFRCAWQDVCQYSGRMKKRVDMSGPNIGDFDTF